MADSDRPADTSNPRGYFEYGKVKRLASDNSWLGEARGRAVKVIVQLLPFLDRKYRYQVLMMRRDLQEILQSQSKMIASLGKNVSVDPKTLASVFERNLATANELVSSFPDMACQFIEFSDLISAPEAGVERVIGFLNRPGLDRVAMVRAVDCGLYRTRIVAEWD